MRPHDDDGQATIKRISGRYDVNGVYIHGSEADRKTQSVLAFNATFPVEVFGSLRELEAKQARYIPNTDTTSPLRGGWLIRSATLDPPCPPKTSRPAPESCSSSPAPTASPRPLPRRIGPAARRISSAPPSRSPP